MNTQLVISEILKKSWKLVKSQIWILAGLLIAYSLISFTVSMFSTPLQKTIAGTVVMLVINMLIGAIFSLGYIKNLFQTMDGDEPQFSAYLPSFRKIINYLCANIIFSIASIIGVCLFVIPGIYIYIRLMYFGMFIVEEDAGIMESLRASWKMTDGYMKPLTAIFFIQLLIIVVGCIIFLIGLFVAIPFIYMIQCYIFRQLNQPSVDEVIVDAAL